MHENILKSDSMGLAEKISVIVLMTIGILCNVFCFFLLSRKRSSKINLNFLFRFMTVTDTVILVQYLVDFIFVIFDSKELRLKSNLFCKFWTYFTFATIPTKGNFEILKRNFELLILFDNLGWFLVFLVLERFLAIRNPRVNMLLIKKRSQTIIAFLIVMFNFIYYLPILINYELNYNGTVCYIKFPNVSILLMGLEMANVLVLPVFVNFLFIMIMLAFLIKSKIKIHNQRIVSVYPLGELSILRTLPLGKYLTYLKVTLFLNFIYFVFNFPHNISDVICIETASNQKSCYNYVVIRIANYLTYSLFGTQLIVYLLICKPVRQEFLLMLGFRKKYHNSQFNIRIALTNMINSVLLLAFNKIN